MFSYPFLPAFVFIHAVVERVLKKHTQVKVPLPSKKCSVVKVKVLVQKNYLSKSKRVAYLKVLMSSELLIRPRHNKRCTLHFFI